MGMNDLKSNNLIVAKGLMFLAIAVLAAVLILIEEPSLRVAAMLVALVWASCRFYYFLFYVLERYVDPSLRYSGLWDLLRALIRRRRKPRREAEPD